MGQRGISGSLERMAMDAVPGWRGREHRVQRRLDCCSFSSLCVLFDVDTYVNLILWGPWEVPRGISSLNVQFPAPGNARGGS